MACIEVYILLNSQPGVYPSFILIIKNLLGLSMSDVVDN